MSGMICLPTAVQEQLLSCKPNPTTTKTRQVRIATSRLTLEIGVGDSYPALSVTTRQATASLRCGCASRPSLIYEVSILSLRTLRTWQEVTLSVLPSITLRAARITPGGGEGSAPAIGLLSRLRAARLASLRQRLACGGQRLHARLIIAPTHVNNRARQSERHSAEAGEKSGGT